MTCPMHSPYDRSATRQFALRETPDDACKSWARLVASLLLLLAAPAWAAQQSEQDTKAEVVYWCIYQMGEFGPEAIDVCVKEELAAAQALAAYPPSTGAIRSRCDKRAGSRGLGAVRACMDDEFAANAKLESYPADQAGRIAACRARYGAAGSTAVVRCVDDPAVPVGTPNPP